MTREAGWCYGIISTVPYEQQKIYRQIILFQRIILFLVVNNQQGFFYIKNVRTKES